MALFQPRLYLVEHRQPTGPQCSKDTDHVCCWRLIAGGGCVAMAVLLEE